MPRAAEISLARRAGRRGLEGAWIGQDQDWYLARFLGGDGDVDIATEDPEFRDWKWIDPAALPDAIVPFKRDLYRRLLREFADYL